MGPDVRIDWLLTIDPFSYVYLVHTITVAILKYLKNSIVACVFAFITATKEQILSMAIFLQILKSFKLKENKTKMSNDY